MSFTELETSDGIATVFLARGKVNALSFGSTIFAGSAEMLRFWVGNAAATKVLSGSSPPRSDAPSSAWTRDPVRRG